MWGNGQDHKYLIVWELPHHMTMGSELHYMAIIEDYSLSSQGTGMEKTGH